MKYLIMILFGGLLSLSVTSVMAETGLLDESAATTSSLSGADVYMNASPVEIPGACAMK